MRLQKHFSLVMAFLLLVSNSGLAINVHFCEGKIAGISSAFSKEEACVAPKETADTCCAKPDPTHKKCCSDKEVNLKNKIEKMLLKTVSVEADAPVLLPEWKPLIWSAPTTQSTLHNFAYCFEANAPPLYKLYCQFTLFG